MLISKEIMNENNGTINKLNGDSTWLDSILAKIISESISGKGFDPNKIKKANQYLEDILYNNNQSCINENEFWELFYSNCFTMYDFKKIIDSTQLAEYANINGWQEGGEIWQIAYRRGVKMLLDNEKIDVIKGVGTEGVAAIMPASKEYIYGLVSPSHFQSIISFFLEQSLERGMSLDTWKTVKTIYNRFGELKAKGLLDEEFINFIQLYSQYKLGLFLEQSLEKRMTLDECKTICKMLNEFKTDGIINEEFIKYIQPILQQIYKDTRMNIDFSNINTISDLLKLSIITPEDVINNSPNEVIHTMIKSKKSIFKSWSDYEILQLIDKNDLKPHEYKQLLNERNINIVKAIKERYCQDFASTQMIVYGDEAKEKAIQNAKLLMRLLEKLPNEYIKNISDDLMYSFYQPWLGIRLNYVDILELLNKGIIDEKKIVDLYEYEQTMLAFGDDIDNQEFLDFLTIERMINIVNDENLAKRFKKMYSNLNRQQSQEQNETRWEKLIDQYMQGEKSQEEKEKEIAKLISEEILPINMIDEDTLLNLVENKQLPYDLLVEEFMQGNVARNMIETVISAQEIPELSAKSLRDLYIENIIDIEDIKTLNDEKMQEFRETLLEIILPEDEEKRNQYMSKINNAYMEDVIDFETLTRMKDNGILSEEEHKKLCELYDEKIALKKLKELEYIINNAKAVPRGKREKGPPVDVTPKRDSEYFRYIINEFGGETTTKEYIKPVYGGNLNGYYFIIKPKARVVIIENPAYSNATYILPLKVALEFVETSNKKALRGTFGVEHLNHPQTCSERWKRNLENKARKVQESIGMQPEECNTLINTTECGDESR